MRHRSSAIVSLAVTGAIAMGFTTRAVAQTAADTGRARACYVPGSGTVYRVKTPKAPHFCVGADHVEFTLGETQTQVAAAGQGGGNTPVDHGSLAGLQDDDHPQYLLADGARSTVSGFAVTGFGLTSAIPASGPGTRLMWYPRKAAFRAGRVTATNWDDTAIGDASMAIGSDSKASGRFSVAMGNYAQSLGLGSAAIGDDARALSDGSIALGSNMRSSGRYAVAMGFGSSASGDVAVAVGSSLQASGEASLALGYGGYTNNQVGAVVISAYMPSVTFPVKAVAPGQFVARANRFWFGNNNEVTALPGQLIATSTGAHLTTGGTWVNSSDSTKKTAFQGVDGESVLAKLAEMPIRTWQYRVEDSTVRHIGPTAQDFRAAYGLGDTETAIATVDADGIALAGVQALERRTRDYTRTSTELKEARRAIQELRATIDALRARVEQLSSAGSNR